MHIHIQSKTTVTSCSHSAPNTSVLPISPNMGTGDLSVNKRENKVTGITFLKKITQIIYCELKSNPFIY